MTIEQVFDNIPSAIDLWEQNMHESWNDYKGADMFVVIDQGEIVGGFAVYRDDSEGVKGLFCSGWAGRHKKVPCDRILQRLADTVGDILFKTNHANSLWPHGLQHARLPCPSQSLGVCSNSCPLTW